MTDNIINMTPHAIVLGQVESTELGSVFQELYVFQPSDKTIRLKQSTEFVKYIGDENSPITLTKTVFGEPEGLPEYKEGTYYLVSQLIKSALPDRKDLLVPAQVFRDQKGIILGCESFGI